MKRAPARRIAGLLILAFQLGPLLPPDEGPGATPGVASRERRRDLRPRTPPACPNPAKVARADAGLRRADAPVGGDIGLIRRRPSDDPFDPPARGAPRDRTVLLRVHPAAGGATAFALGPAASAARPLRVILRC